MDKKPYSISYVKPALKWCLTYKVLDKSRKSEVLSQRQEWFETFEEADLKGKEVCG